MPQAPDSLRREWPGGDTEAIAFLEASGYELTRDFRWRRPAAHIPTKRENSALDYLWLEWDFGGLAE